MIHRQADRMTQLIQQLLSITRLEQGTEPAQREALDLAALVTGGVRRPAPPGTGWPARSSQGVGRGGTGACWPGCCKTSSTTGLPTASPRAMWVTLGTEGDQAVLQVRDDGIGIPQDQQEKIWQRFYQVDPARREGAGPGWGWPW